MSMKFLAVLAAATIILAPASLARAQDGSLGTILVEYSPDTIERLTAPEMERKAALTVWDALKSEPGLALTHSGGRAEGTISIRGSNRYQVGMYIDDVPVATVYRNEFDLTNSMLFDIESIEVSKGYTSPLLAANNSDAGAINMRTHKPARPLELLFKYRNNFDRSFDDQGRMYGIRLGTKQRLFYLQVAAFEERRDFFTLPGGFTPGFYEDGGRRDNSDFKNSRLNFIAGFTPTEDIDIMVGYVKQEYEKGQPFDAAPEGLHYYRHWRWPVYETERFYLNAQGEFLDRLDVKLMAYYDKHTDMSVDYRDTTLTAKRNPDRLYDEFTKGLQLRLGYEFTPAHRLDASAGWRRASHKQFDDYNTSGVGGNYLAEYDIEDYLDLGAEYTFKPINELALVAGTSWTKVTPRKNDYRRNGTSAFTTLDNMQSVENKIWNWQLGAFWEFLPENQLFATVAKKGRMPTMRERFLRANNNSTAPSNPNLGPEKAMHYEIGYRGKPLAWLETVASVYHSDYTGKIIQISVPITNDRMMINTNSTKIWGFELGAQAQLGEMVLAGLSLSLLKGKHVLDSRDTSNEFFDEPTYHGTAWASITPADKLTITPQIDFQSGYRVRMNNSVTNQTVDFWEGGFVTADLRVAYDVNDYLTLEAGAKNIFDKLYSYNWYYPQPGRNFYLGLTAKY